MNFIKLLETVETVEAKSKTKTKTKTKIKTDTDTVIDTEPADIDADAGDADDDGYVCDEVTDNRYQVVIENPVAKQDGETDAENVITRRDWEPWWAALPRGLTIDNLDDFTNRHCGNCSKGCRALNRKFRSLSALGCGIGARVKVLGDGYVTVTSHCSGAVSVYPEGLIKI